MKKRVLVTGIAVVLAAGLLYLCARSLSGFGFGSGSGGRSAADVTESLPATLKAAAMYESAGDYRKARGRYLSALEKYPASRDTAKIQESIDDLNIKIILSPAETPDSFRYEVKKGDTISRISREFRNTTELIMRANGLKDTSIVPGEKLKINRSRFSIWVSKSSNLLALKSDGVTIKVYWVSTGRNNSTPAGNFSVTTRIVDPPWYKDNKVIPSGSPENILGTRWMGISKKSYGIHGTTEPQSIGKQATAGCVRMRNTDVEELFALAPVGTEVTIVE